MKNYRKVIIWKLLVFVLVLALAIMIKMSLPPSSDDAWTEIGGPTRSPSWWAEHCDYIEIDPLDESPDLPDGVYENCDEISTPKKDLSDRYNEKSLDPNRTLPGEPPRSWERVNPFRRLKNSVIY